MVPIAQNEVIVTNFNGSTQNHILTNSSCDNDSKLLSNLESNFCFFLFVYHHHHINFILSLSKAPLYFMVQTTPEISQANKLISKSNSSNKIYSNNNSNSSNKTVRDEKRRANHNEGEF